MDILIVCKASEKEDGKCRVTSKWWMSDLHS